MLEREKIQEIVLRNPQVDPTALERSREIAQRLLEAGIASGDYGLEPALAGRVLQRQELAARATRAHPVDSDETTSGVALIRPRLGG